MITIMSMTWKELLRKRVMMLTVLMTVVFLAAFWFVAKTISTVNDGPASLGREGEMLLMSYGRGVMILSMGFFFASFVTAFLGIFSSFSAISGEAEQGVLQALMPRPLPRWKWYIGRWLGYVTVGILYSLLLFTAILLITDAHASVPRDMGGIIRSFLLFASTIPLLVTVSMLGSSLFSALGNGVFMTMLYGAGWLGGTIDKVSGNIGLEESVEQSLNNLSGLLSMLMPVDGLQRRMMAELTNIRDMGRMAISDDLMLGLFGLNHVPSNPFLLYALLYGAVFFLLGMFRFQRKDL